MKLFTLWGIPVKLDLSFVIVIGFLMTRYLGFRLLVEEMGNVPFILSLASGIFGVTILALSIIFHEFAHIRVGHIFGLEFKDITLFFLGGIARMTKGSQHWYEEFWTAIAGPISSFFLAGVFYLVELILAQILPAPNPLSIVVHYGVFINLLLGGFNLLTPAFPLDGGRIVRAIVWRYHSRINSYQIAIHITNGVVGILLLYMAITDNYRFIIIAPLLLVNNFRMASMIKKAEQAGKLDELDF